ncbi:MAG: hypothetical protein AB7S78_12580 [Candidatus Omnitrophota bacterium]
MTTEPQPIDIILTERGLTNEDLVKASTEQLTFKQVRKARAGRPVSPNIQEKIVRALNACGGEVRYRVGEIFKRDKG